MSSRQALIFAHVELLNAHELDQLLQQLKNSKTVTNDAHGHVATIGVNVYCGLVVFMLPVIIIAVSKCDHPYYLRICMYSAGDINQKKKSVSHSGHKWRAVCNVNSIYSKP